MLGGLDIVVDGSILVELKSVERLEPIHSAQTVTYMKLSGCRFALLLNFNSVHLRDGIRRFVPRGVEAEQPSLLPSFLSAQPLPLPDGGDSGVKT